LTTVDERQVWSHARSRSDVLECEWGRSRQPALAFLTPRTSKPTCLRPFLRRVSRRLDSDRVWTVVSVCSSSVHDLAPDLPPTVFQLFAAPLPLLIRPFRSHSQSSADPNWRSNPIAHRARRKRQRLPPSLLIENASDQHFPTRTVLPEASPIKASDKPEITNAVGVRRRLRRGGHSRCSPWRRRCRGCCDHSRRVAGSSGCAAAGRDWR
jgi:hypothetical protein